MNNPAPAAHVLATATLALLEGALLLARAHRGREPLLRAGRTITALLSRHTNPSACLSRPTPSGWAAGTGSALRW